MAMNAVFERADGLGPYKTIHVYNPEYGIQGILVIDNVAMGPAIGGLRMASDVSLDECARLARAMTFKNAAAELPHGGGKSVLIGDPLMPLEDKENVIRGFAAALRNEDQYIFGPDMGTNEQCMAWIKDEIGRSVGLPEEQGGIPLDQVGATGWGLTAAAEVAQKYCDLDLNGATLAVQGFGAVGSHVARFLAERGVKLVAAADIKGTVYDPNGLDLDQLWELKEAGRSVIEAEGVEVLDRDAVIGIECDIWIPAARPDVIHMDNVSQLKTRLILQGANIPITHDAERKLHEAGVLIVPDFIANAGGVICAAMEYEGASQKVTFDTVWSKIAANTAEILDAVKKDHLLPREAGLNIAKRRLCSVMRNRRWRLY